MKTTAPEVPSRRTDFSSLNAKILERVKRSDPVFKAVFDELETLKDIVAGLVVEVSRDKSLPEKLRSWLKSRTGQDLQAGKKGGERR